MSDRPGDGRAENLRVAGVLVLLALLYAAGVFGLVSSNDGSHFAATRALAESGSFRIGDGVVFALNDVAVVDGDSYSNKAPGTALLAVPFYWLSGPLDGVLRAPPSGAELAWYEILWGVASGHGIDVSLGSLSTRYASTRPAQDSVSLVAVLAGVLTLWMVYRTSRGLGASHWASLATLLALGSGTLLWRYSTALFSHVPSAALLMVQLEWLVSGRAWRSRMAAGVWGLLLGLGVMVEYPAALTLAPLLVGWWLGAREALDPRETGRRVALLCAGGAVCALWLAWFHQAHFGGPFATPVGASAHFGYAASLGDLFGGSFADGTRSLLFSAENRGLFRVSPIVAVALLGWLCWPKRGRRWLGVAAAVVLVHALLIFHVEAPDGGGTRDHRYLLRVVPVLLLPLGLALDRGVQLSQRLGAGRAFALAVGAALVLALYALSVVRSADAVEQFVKHRMLLTEGSGGHLAALFPSAGHTTLLALAAVAVVAMALAAARFRAVRRPA